MQVSRLRVHPIKSFAGNDVETAQVLPWGLADDRRFSVVDPGGEPITAREANELLGLTVAVRPDGGLMLSDRDPRTPTQAVDLPINATPIPVGHSRLKTALPAGDAADAWLSARLTRPARLVWQADPLDRPVSPDHGGQPGDHVSLADVGPLLLTSESSLAQLDRWIGDDAAPLNMLRFRPNVVIDGDAEDPFAEDRWSFVRVGDVRFRVSGVCDRCVMTTIDPVTLQRGKEPIRTMAMHRRWNGKTWFGVWLVPVLTTSASPAVISVGDTVVPE